MDSEANTIDLELVKLRRALHASAELADDERVTATLVREFIQRHDPDEMVGGLGGHGLAAVYRGKDEGPTVLFRAELDALPIAEKIDVEHASQRDGVAHKCGHDGHMAMVAGLASRLAVKRPSRGRVVLLFQPAEETGQGALRVLQAPEFEPLRPDKAFALHNLPKFPLGQVVMRRGVFSAASKGLVVELDGATSHAAEPHLGTSPTLAVAQLLQSLCALPQETVPLGVAAKVTPVYARLGEVAFGTAPGRATVMATLRAYDPEVMASLSARCVHLIAGLGATHDLETQAFWTEQFPATVCSDATVTTVQQAVNALGLDCHEPADPFPWSEDFGHFTASFEGALIGLGAGVDHAALHHPDYDFPDELLATGTRLLAEIARIELAE